MSTVYTAAPFLLTAIIAALLALVVFYYGPGRPPNRALSAHLVTLAAIAGGYTIAALSGEAPDILSSAWISAGNDLINMSVIFGIALALSWPERRAWTPRTLATLWPYATVGILLSFAEAVLPNPERGLPLMSWWSVVTLVSLLLLGLALGAANLLVHEALREDRAGIRDGRIFMALGLTLTIFHVMPRNLLLLPRYIQTTDGPYLIGSIGTLLLFPLAVVLLAGIWRIRGSRAARLGVLLIMASMLAGAFDAIASFVVTGTGLAAQAIFGFRFFMYALWRLIPVALLAYVVLRGQVPGLDVKVRWGISRSTVAAAFVVVFFVASEGAQIVFGSENAWIGLGAAAVLVFAIAPLQRAAERLAEKAIPYEPPNSDPRGAESYRRAVRLALKDRRFTADEELQLAAVAHDLGLTAPDAIRIRLEVEREAMTKGGETASSN